MHVDRKRARASRQSPGALRMRSQAKCVPSVMWVGISDKPATSPLAATTATGKVVAQMERELAGLHFHKTNLVKYAPLDANGRLRHPTKEEMAEGADSLQLELDQVQPRIIVTLGAAVSKVVVERIARTGRFTGLGNSFTYAPRLGGGFLVLPVHHPSFVLIYRRKKLQAYIRSICRWIADLVNRIATVGLNGPEMAAA